MSGSALHTALKHNRFVNLKQPGHQEREKNLNWKITCIRLSYVYVYEEETWLVMDVRESSPL